MINEIPLALWFILPAYIANSTAALFGGGKPIDFGRDFSDGRRVFGEGKTFLGLFAGIAFGTIAGNVQGYLIADGLVPGYMAGGVLTYTVAGFLLATGALLGDLASSLVKRRLPGFRERGPCPVPHHDCDTPRADARDTPDFQLHGAQAEGEA